MRALDPDEVRARRFPLVRRGYRRREVDRFLARAAADISRLRDGGGPGGPPPLTPDDVEQARFHKSLRGYDMPQVDDFLDELAAELARVRQRPRPRSAGPLPHIGTLPALPPPPPPPPPRLTAADVAAAVFQRAARGYAMAEVDAFLDRVVAELERLEAGREPEGGARAMHAADVRDQRFTVGPRGYEMHDVDMLLDRLAGQLPEAPRPPGDG